MKPCPFCNAKAFIDIYMDREYVSAKHKKGCIKPDTWHLAKNGYSVRRQITLWNRRDGEKK